MVVDEAVTVSEIVPLFVIEFRGEVNVPVPEIVPSLVMEPLLVIVPEFDTVPELTVSVPPELTANVLPELMVMVPPLLVIPPELEIAPPELMVMIPPLTVSVPPELIASVVSEGIVSVPADANESLPVIVQVLDTLFHVPDGLRVVVQYDWLRV